MFYDGENERIFNPEGFIVDHHSIYTLTTGLGFSRYGMRSVPTHTEDGIPIRKLYVSNLPPKTTRTELFGVFAQYGIIKSCWLRMGEKVPNKPPLPTYAFVTFTNPQDAHKALHAPHHEKILRGRSLRISPADSWHQPAEDADGKVLWGPRSQRRDNTDAASTSNNTEQPDAVNTGDERQPEIEEEQNIENNVEPIPDSNEDDTEIQYSMLDVLNRDCLNHILSYVPITDLIRSERVSKSWQNMIHEYLQGIHTFKTSWWQHKAVTLTTAKLRLVLQRLGAALTRLHIDHHWSALNDRTAHTLGKFCPNLEELKVMGMNTRNWNPIVYGCKKLRNLSFISCNKLTDSSLANLVKQDTCLESLTVANNTHVTGLFLTGSVPSKLTSLSFENCYNLQGTVLCAVLENMPNITTLKLDMGPTSLWKMVPCILKKLPKLEELSLSDYIASDMSVNSNSTEALCEALATLKELKSLNLRRNRYVNNAVLKQIAQTCHKLESLNVSCCNAKNSIPHSGVTDEGISYLSRVGSLRRIDVSYLSGLSDAGVTALVSHPQLRQVTARGNNALTAEPFCKCLDECHELQEIDVCGCDGVSAALVAGGVRAVGAHPRTLSLRLGGTAAAAHDMQVIEEYPTHKLVTVNLQDDYSNPHLRPDFVDVIFDNSSDDSLDDPYYPDDYDDFLESENDSVDYHDDIIWGLNIPDLIGRYNLSDTDDNDM